MESAITDVFGARNEIEGALRTAGLERLMSELEGEWVRRSAEVVPQYPHSNIYDCEPNAVPALKATISGEVACFACLVYGNPGESVPGARDGDVEGRLR